MAMFVALGQRLPLDKGRNQIGNEKEEESNRQDKRGGRGRPVELGMLACPSPYPYPTEFFR